MNEMLKTITELFPKDVFPFPTGYEDSIIGVDPISKKLIISRDAMHMHDIETGEMDMEESMEWHWYNTFTAGHGPQTPIFVGTEEE